MTALTLTPTTTARITRITDRARDIAEAVYEGPAPVAGPGVGGKLRHIGYVAASALGWGLAALVVTGLLAALVSLV